MIKVIESWRVEITLTDLAVPSEDKKTVVFFATEEHAKLAVEWAYAVRLEQVGQYPRASAIMTKFWPSSDHADYCRKIEWNLGIPGKPGYAYGREDYFSYTFERIEREVFGEAV